MPHALLQDSQLPAFDQFAIPDFKPSIEALISEYKALISAITSQPSYSWSKSIAPLSDMQRRLDHIWSLLSHYKAVMDDEETRELYKALSAQLTTFRSEKAQNAELFAVYKSVSEGEQGLDVAQTKVLDNALLGFHLSGVDLEEAQQTEFKDLSQTLVQLSNRFAENVLDATQSWSLYVDDIEDLKGVPDATLKRLAERAQAESHEHGYLLGLDMTLYLPVMQYCQNRQLRERLYRAYITRASSLGEHEASLANESNMRDILQARRRKAELLGFSSYAELSLQTKMAESPDHVLQFLQDLQTKASSLATRELADLEEFSKRELGIDSVQAWDYQFVSESYRKANFDIDQEQLRSYFQLPKVLDRMFKVAESLFGVTLELDPQASLPHQDTQCYRIKYGDEVRAYIYMDLYAREGKRSGAWVAPCHKRSHDLTGACKLPTTFLVCNFSAPQAMSGKQAPSLITHTEMVTLFHEFGHALHHCLTVIDLPEVSGISGVPWDAVELPSQFLENWCWQPEVIKDLSEHIETGEGLPDEYIRRLMNAKSFLAGLQTLRQLEFATFDFRLHHEFNNETDVQALLEQVQGDISLIPVPSFARFANAFAHIFSGGYAAGYYSYKWAEVLAADAFSAFQEEGVMNPQTGERFLREILSRGGTGDVNEMFKAFRGRMPSSEALLKQMGA